MWEHDFLKPIRYLFEKELKAYFDLDVLNQFQTVEDVIDQYKIVEDFEKLVYLVFFHLITPYTRPSTRKV